ncbi:hypothetical protein DFH27DRAFT_232265 [Peziza echinospora]|nr:hypothetical protein DFH27DRAFT_232265 [Peziza echinospora]
MMVETKRSTCGNDNVSAADNSFCRQLLPTQFRHRCPCSSFSVMCECIRGGRCTGRAPVRVLDLTGSGWRPARARRRRNSRRRRRRRDAVDAHGDERKRRRRRRRVPWRRAGQVSEVQAHPYTHLPAECWRASYRVRVSSPCFWKCRLPQEEVCMYEVAHCRGTQSRQRRWIARGGASSLCVVRCNCPRRRVPDATRRPPRSTPRTGSPDIATVNRIPDGRGCMLGRPTPPRPKRQACVRYLLHLMCPPRASPKACPPDRWPTRNSPGSAHGV